LITNFVEKRSKETPGPKIEGELATVFKQLEAQFAQLKVLKDEVTEAFKKEAKPRTMSSRPRLLSTPVTLLRNSTPSIMQTALESWLRRSESTRPTASPPRRWESKR